MNWAKAWKEAAKDRRQLNGLHRFWTMFEQLKDRAEKAGHWSKAWKGIATYQAGRLDYARKHWAEHNARTEKAEKERDEARAACGELRAAIQTHSECSAPCEQCGHSTSCHDDDVALVLAKTDVGRDWTSPEETERLKKELTRAQCDVLSLKAEAVLMNDGNNRLWAQIERLRTENEKLRAELKEAREALRIVAPYIQPTALVTLEGAEKLRDLVHAILSKGGGR